MRTPLHTPNQPLRRECGPRVGAPEAGTPRQLPVAQEYDTFELAEVGLFVIQEGVIARVNPALASLVGATIDSLVGQPLEALMAPASRACAPMVLDRRMAGRAGGWARVKCLHADGSSFEARASSRGLRSGGRPAVLVTLLDVSDFDAANRRAARNAQRLVLAEMLGRSGSMEVEWPGGQVRLSSGLRTLLGLGEGCGVGNAIDTLAWVPAEARGLVAEAWRAASPGEPFELEHGVIHADGRRLTVLQRGVLLDEPETGPLGVAVLRDITEQREAERRAREDADRDEVTGLPNRASLLASTDAAIRAARSSGEQLVLVAVEVPQVGYIKATMGFSAADTLVRELADRMRQACHAGESMGRIADAELAVVIPVQGPLDEAGLRRRVSELLEALGMPVRLNATDVFPRCVAGAAAFPRDADAATGLLESAQTARLSATGAPDIAFFRPEANLPAMRAMAVESALRLALDRSEFELHYQPQVELLTGKIRGAEALLRWNSRELGRVSPAEFIPVAERSGLIGAIGEWVLHTACRDLADWQRRKLPRVRVGINLSPAELQRPQLAAEVQRALMSYGVDAGCLSIELTEGMVMEDMEHAARVLGELRALGVEIALDDFGTGFSSLSYLCRLPIDVLKIDRSFVHDVTAPLEELSVTRAIINMAHGLQMQVLAEGVETEGQLGLLSSNGCDMVQGFWFSGAVPAHEFETMLTAGKCLPERLLGRAGKTRTLLLVDDEENILAALRRLFRRDGYQILTASSGEEGLRRLAEHDVDVIVSDQRMPGMTGVDFLNRAKALYPQTVRMALSGYTELQSIIDAVNEGAIYKFLTKPWEDERLRAHVAEAFRQKELSDENRRLSQQVEAANADLANLNERLETLLSHEQQQAEVLAANSENMRRLVEELPAALVAIDPDGLIVLVNRDACERLPGAGHWIGRFVQDVWPPALAAAAMNRTHMVDAVRLDGRDFEVATRHLPATTQPPCLLFLFTPSP